MCELNSIIEFINQLNTIPSPTDGEDALIKFIAALASEQNINVQSVKPKPYLRVSPILIGNPDAKNILVIHCDRVIKDVFDNKAKPLFEATGPLVSANGIFTGKLDNTVSLAVCLKIFIKLKLQSTNLLITTSEEGKLLNINDNERNQLHDGIKHVNGGRGLISFLDDNIPAFKDKRIICVDVRPLDKKDVFLNSHQLMELGDGLVLRTKEQRDHIDIGADLNIVRQIQQCASQNNINLINFEGGGITELGRGFEKVIRPLGFLPQDYHVAWIQPPIKYYHTLNEQMSGKDIIALCKVIKCMIESFEQ